MPQIKKFKSFQEMQLEWHHDQTRSESRRARRRTVVNGDPMPLQPEAVMPQSSRTEKRIVRAAIKEVMRPRPPATTPLLAVNPDPPKESLRAKLVRLGWQSESGASLDWRYWNKARKTVYFDSSTSRTIEAQE